jgi:chromosome partitioning protein
MYDQRTKLAQQVVKQVSAYFGDSVFRTIIPRNVRLSEAPSHGKPVSRYDSKCAGALAYKSLAAEVLDRDKAAGLPKTNAPKASAEESIAAVEQLEEL